MHGCARGDVVYRWHEDEDDKMIDFRKTSHPFEMYFDDQVRDHGGTPIYGKPCELDKTTGKSVLDEESKTIVRNAFALYKKLKESEGTKVKSEVGFFVAISGDMEYSRTGYEVPLLE